MYASICIKYELRIYEYLKENISYKEKLNDDEDLKLKLKLVISMYL